MARVSPPESVVERTLSAGWTAVPNGRFGSGRCRRRSRLAARSRAFSTRGIEGGELGQESHEAARGAALGRQAGRGQASSGQGPEGERLVRGRGVFGRDLQQPGRGEPPIPSSRDRHVTAGAPVLFAAPLPDLVASAGDGPVPTPARSYVLVIAIGGRNADQSDAPERPPRPRR
jgi:hypothetical protein